MMEIIAARVYNPKLHRQEVFFDDKWNPIIDLHSYGHDIETAWLVDRGVACPPHSHHASRSDVL